MKQVRIRNFGPILDAVIDIKAFTIFGGSNNTGKSFASRLIYSLLKSLQYDLYNQRVNTLLGSLQPSFMWEIENFSARKKKKDKENILALNSIAAYISSLITELDNLDSKDLKFTTIKKLVLETIDGIERAMADLDLDRSNFLLVEIAEQLTIYVENLRHFNEQINLPNIRDTFIQRQLRENIERELKGNFQITGLSAFHRNSDAMPSVQFTEGNTIIDFTLNRQPKESPIRINTLNAIRVNPSNLFLESPVYWKLEALFNRPYMGFSSRKIDFRRPISGVPDYVTSLRAELSKEYTGEVAFPEILEWIGGVVGGRIVISNAGQLRFSDGNNLYPLQTTATGIANIGMIGLLIERKLISEQTVLFIDEPECNLHTAWQVVMAELLMKLSRAGVHVVIATHSTEILKYVANCSEHDPEIADHVAINHFPFHQNEEQDFVLKLNNILMELTEPYYNLFWSDT